MGRKEREKAHSSFLSSGVFMTSKKRKDSLCCCYSSFEFLLLFFISIVGEGMARRLFFFLHRARPREKKKAVSPHSKPITRTPVKTTAATKHNLVNGTQEQRKNGVKDSGGFDSGERVSR